VVYLGGNRFCGVSLVDKTRQIDTWQLRVVFAREGSKGTESQQYFLARTDDS